MFSFIRRLLQGTTFNFLKRCKSILEPAVNSCLEAAALLLDSFSQLERAVILPQCLEEKKSILGFTWRDRRKKKEIFSYGSYSKTCFSKNVFFLVWLFCNMIRRPMQFIIHHISGHDIIEKGRADSILLSTWNSFCDLALNCKTWSIAGGNLIFTETATVSSFFKEWALFCSHCSSPPKTLRQKRQRVV